MKLMYQSIPAAPSPHPGYCEAFACFFSPGGGAFANFALPGGRAFANPGAIPELVQDTHAVSYQKITTWRILLKKKQISSSVKNKGL